MQLQRAEERREAAETRAKELEKQVFMISCIVYFCRHVCLFTMLMVTFKLGMPCNRLLL